MSEPQDPYIPEGGNVLQFPGNALPTADPQPEPDTMSDSEWNANHLATMALHLVEGHEGKPVIRFPEARQCLVRALAILDEQELYVKADRILGPRQGPVDAA